MSSPITLITGTRKGIGKFLALHYCEKGHLVFGCSRGEPDWSHERYRHFEADVTSESAVKRIFSAVRKEHGRLDNLLNNAGIASMNHSLLTPVDTVRKVLETNVVGSFLFCREAAKLMKKNQYGRIVNFSTVAVPLKLEGEAAYVASKAGVEGLTNVLSREFANLGITVNTVGPVPIETDLIRAVPKDKIEQLVARQTIKRLGSLQDVAQVTDFFLDPGSAFITGQHIYLGGL
ncbi:MAG: SDR family oxidoreductase [Woeseiaceae bacterium]|nr:SDR family oxidoreductase [Woeseiaceae bacterium]